MVQKIQQRHKNLFEQYFLETFKEEHAKIVG